MDKTTIGPGRWFLRSALIICVASMATTVIYFTPTPDPYFMSCDRPCHELDWPMICRIRLTLEVYQTLSSSCGNCPINETDCWNSYCITADGNRRGILTANRQLPGPSIQVCENDIMVIDVVNRVPGHGISVHWRGLPQYDTPFMDGVSMLTQCPIPSYTTFQYKFRASKPGTHLWHAHGGAEMADGLVGAFIVRRALANEPHKNLYDYDLAEHVIILTEWTKGFALQRLLQSDYSIKPDNLLLNGKAINHQMNLPAAKFIVKQGKKYRFRIAHAGVISACPIKIIFTKHLIKIINIDGNPIEPKDVTSIILASGERIDIVLNANNKIKDYDIIAESQCNGETITQKAILQYELFNNNKKFKIIKNNNNDNTLQELNTVSHNCGTIDDNNLCLSELKSLNIIDNNLFKSKMDYEIDLPFDFGIINQNTPPSFFVSGYGDIRVPHVSNFSFIFPPSPLVTQFKDVPNEILCHKELRPEFCNLSGICECVHQIDIPLGSTVQLNLRDLSGEILNGHVFHLHGHNFHIVREINKNEISLSPGKDTVNVPPGHVVKIRFIANNPGYWLLHDQHIGHSTRGLSVVLHVGGEWDLPTPPSDFPKCGSWRGPDFFLV